MSKQVKSGAQIENWKAIPHPEEPGYLIRAIHRDDQGRRCTNYVAHVLLSGGDAERYGKRARLIAAAPDLLEACRYMHKLLVDMGHGGLAGAILGDAAITKATEGQ